MLSPHLAHTQTYSTWNTPAYTRTRLHSRIKMGWIAVMRINRCYKEKTLLENIKKRRDLLESEWKGFMKRREGRHGERDSRPWNKTGRQRNQAFKQGFKKEGRGFSFCFRLFLGRKSWTLRETPSEKDLADEFEFTDIKRADWIIALL